MAGANKRASMLQAQTPIKAERRSVYVYYYGAFTPELDEKIQEALEAAGFERWASGFGMGEREILFFVPEEDER